MKKTIFYLIFGIVILILLASLFSKSNNDIIGKWNLFDGSGNIYGTYEFTNDNKVFFDVMGNKMDAKYEDHGDHLLIIASDGVTDKINYEMPNKNKLILLGEHPVELLRAK